MAHHSFLYEKIYKLLKFSKSWAEITQITHFLLYHRVWSSNVIVHEKSGLFAQFFRIISITAETILIKKIGRNHGISVYKKALISEHRKNYIFRDNCFVKMPVSLLGCQSVCNQLLWTSQFKNQCDYQNQISHLVLVH